MKKFSVIIFVFISLLFSFTSCGKDVDLTCYVSQNRHNVYLGENEEYKLTAYEEKRENPFVADGYIGSVENYVILKIESKTQSVDGVSCLFKINNTEYKGDFVYNPINNKFTLEILVSEFNNSNQLDVQLFKETSTCTITLKSVLFAQTKGYKEVLKSVSNYDKSTINRLFKNDKVCTEINVRLLYDDDKNYYYVGFVEKDKKTTCYLIDGQTLQVLATKNVE